MPSASAYGPFTCEGPPTLMAMCPSVPLLYDRPPTMDFPPGPGPFSNCGCKNNCWTRALGIGFGFRVGHFLILDCRSFILFILKRSFKAVIPRCCGMLIMIPAFNFVLDERLYKVRPAGVWCCRSWFAGLFRSPATPGVCQLQFSHPQRFFYPASSHRFDGDTALLEQAPSSAIASDDTTAQWRF